MLGKFILERQCVGKAEWLCLSGFKTLGCGRSGRHIFPKLKCRVINFTDGAHLISPLMCVCVCMCMCIRMYVSRVRTPSVKWQVSTNCHSRLPSTFFSAPLFIHIHTKRLKGRKNLGGWTVGPGFHIISWTLDT